MKLKLELQFQICLLVMWMLLLMIDAHKYSYHPECGESPTKKYKDLAKAIGWDWYQLIKFIKAERPEEFEKMLKAVKLYLDCLNLSQIPI